MTSFDIWLTAIRAFRGPPEELKPHYWDNFEGRESPSFLSHELLEGEFAVVVAVPAREQARHFFPERGNLAP